MWYVCISILIVIIQFAYGIGHLLDILQLNQNVALVKMKEEEKIKKLEVMCRKLKRITVKIMMVI